MGGVLNNLGYVPLKIGGWRDHVHLLVGCNLVINIPNLVKDVKLAASSWIQPRTMCHFLWQRGYGAFSVSKKDVKELETYIENQPTHHSKISFLEEFRQLFISNGVEFDERYFFKELE